MKKGFTLVELLGVIVVLGILGAVSVPTVTSIINNNADNIDKAQEKMIISAARSYVTSNGFNPPNCVNISTLKQEGYLDDISIKSAKTETSFDDYSVAITKNGDNFTYAVQDHSC